MKKTIIIMLLITITSCATRPLTEPESKVRILRNSDAPKECVEKGMVYVSMEKMLTWEGIENELKIEAFKLGADTVAIIGGGASGYRSGKSFKCN